MSFAMRICVARPQPEEISQKRWLYLPYDQLHPSAGLLATATPQDTGLIFVESREKAMRRPYHKKKLALLLSNERHFALEQAARGFSILYLTGDTSISAQLRQAIATHSIPKIFCAEPAERELRHELSLAALPLQFVPNTLWLSTSTDFSTACGKLWRMDAFYREMRRNTGILMHKGKPIGGRFSFDGENRKPWHGEPEAPLHFSVTPDEITQEVLALVERYFPNHVGTLANFDLPCSEADAEAAWKYCKDKLLPHFGPYEDALSTRSRSLFHSRLSALLNLGRLSPLRMIEETVALLDEGKMSLPSAEGFVRQILGWREFVRHVHTQTDGFRTLQSEGAPNHLEAHNPLPHAFWDASKTGLFCLDHVLQEVAEDGYSHHISRLMVISNIATLLGCSPRDLTDWFWGSYVDAYDWVVEPNVLGMGTFAAGDLMTTKPYVSGAAYIHKMSDFCEKCAYDPSGKGTKPACPITSMYWAFLHRNAERLQENERMKLPLASARKRSEAQKKNDLAVTERLVNCLCKKQGVTM